MKTEILELDGWTLRVRRGDRLGPQQAVVMLHGWLGNEDVMWVFADRLPPHFLVIAPRALFPAPLGGYSWVRQRADRLSELPEFDEAAQNLVELPDLAAERFGAQRGGVHLMGFSQGAAACFAWAARRPDQIRSIASLAGFVPEDGEQTEYVRLLAGIPVFIAHGTEDAVVPIDVIRKGAAALETAGAKLTICEARTGHKLGPNCHRALGEFYRSLIPG